MTAKLKDLSAAFNRIEKLDKATQDAYEQREAELGRIRREGARVARSAIRKAKWVRGATLLAVKDAGWAIGIYQGSSLAYPPVRAGEKWSFRIHTMSVRENGKPGTKKGVHWVSVDDPSQLAASLKIVGVISDGKAAAK